MRKKHIMQGLLLFAIAISPLYPATVSFLVMETGLSVESPASQQSAMWENGLLDVFFEAGHIVSNSPIMRLRQRPGDGFPGEAKRDFELAKEGMMDFFVIAVVSHPAPYNVSLRMFRTNSQQMILEHQYTYKTYKTRKEEYDAIKQEILVLAARIR
ncbi:MAG: hypothetical protein LBQ69_05745 [Treponema sp.]|nr:hypothetical protein [Treponema sp.]